MQIPADAFEAVLEFTAAVGAADAQDVAAQLLEAEFAEFGYEVAGIDGERDEGIIWVELRNIGKFVVQVGITRPDGRADRIRVSLYPPLPHVRVWFRKCSTRALVERLGYAVTTILERSGRFSGGRRLDRILDPVPEGALFVGADEPLLVFTSGGEAERALEAVDVRAGVYSAAYDALGRPYRIAAEGDHVAVVQAGGPCRPEELQLLIRDYLCALDMPPGKDAPLDELVAQAWALGRP